MAVLTGNQGVVYLAQYTENSALAIDASFDLSSKVLAGSAITGGTVVTAESQSGGGSGAQGTIWANSDGTGDIATSTAARNGYVIVTNGGSSYSAGDKIIWFLNDSAISDEVTVSSTVTTGIDRASELRVAGNKLARVKSWSLDIANDVLDTTTLGAVSNARTFVQGGWGATGSATLMYYRDDGSGDPSNKDIGDIRSLIFSSTGGQRVIMSLGVNASSSEDFVFKAYITGASLAVNYGEVVAVDVSFTMDGTFFETPAA